VSFNHSKKSEELTGFDRKFYDAVVEMGTIICDATEAKPKKVRFTYDTDEKRSLLVTLTVDASGLGVTPQYVENYASIISGHFPAFFTPAHFRPYGEILTRVDGRKVEIMASYGEGV